MYSAFRCPDYYGDSVTMAVKRFRQSTFHAHNIACAVSGRIFVRFRLLQMADSGYIYRNNTGIPTSPPPSVTIAIRW
jgi:hypothetical protein